ncbi:DUF1491 family protein [Pseudochrobactrum sp. MP213Fo]|uniref:DUF1491 family protein n=1 Tax=Pseudochrobactrum sp. MP213Fo TaxID=3022250 RepID=UPI003BA3BB93
MRLTSEFWVSALMRRIRGVQGFAYLVRRGATEAGAIFIKIRNQDGRFDLYMPAPQSEYDPERTDDRQFILYKQSEDEQLINEQLEKELRFDPDLWLVEIEDCPQAAEIVTGKA